MSLLLLAVACAPDLPEGWEDAEPIADFTQSGCGGDPYEDSEPVVSATATDGSVDVAWDNAHFRCSQDVEGFYKTDGDALSVLVQPIDMHPSSVAKCDCLYAIDMGVPVAATSVTVWRRWDAINDPNDPVEMTTVEVE